MWQTRRWRVGEMPVLRGGVQGVEWLSSMGLTAEEISALNPCVPGEFTVPETCYVNSATPRIVYHAGEEGTLPLVTGRWYIIPNHVVGLHPDLRRDTVPVARAVRLTRSAEGRG
jgi:hypothetical protein